MEMCNLSFWDSLLYSVKVWGSAYLSMDEVNNIDWISEELATYLCLSLFIQLVGMFSITV